MSDIDTLSSENKTFEEMHITDASKLELPSDINGHTVQAYDEELHELISDLLQMGSLVRAVLQASKDIILDHDPDQLELAYQTDVKINELEQKVNTHATTILALRAPVAIDLRMVTASTTIATILERMGDIAKKTFKRTRDLSPDMPDVFANKLGEMIDVTDNMLVLALQSFEQLSISLADQVEPNDDIADEIYQDLLKDLTVAMQEQPDLVPSCIQFILIAKNFERFGDYATKIAKIVCYIKGNDLSEFKSQPE